MHEVISQSELKIHLCLCRKITASHLSPKKGRGLQPSANTSEELFHSASKSLPIAIRAWGLGSISNFNFLL